MFARISGAVLVVAGGMFPLLLRVARAAQMYANFDEARGQNALNHIDLSLRAAVRALEDADG